MSNLQLALPGVLPADATVEWVWHDDFDEVTDVKVGRRRVEPELDAKLLASVEPRAQMIFDVDLHRPLAQALEELRRHG